MATAWIHFLGWDAGLPSQRTVEFTLRAAGIDLVPIGAGDNAGIVAFGSDDAGACSVIREASASGLTRIVALGFMREAGLDGMPWALLAAGASEALVWSGDGTARQLAAQLSRWREIDTLAESAQVRDVLVGKGRTWGLTVRQIIEVACYTDATVLLSGETGTGKELVARLIHSLDRRKDKGDFVVVDCTTIVPTLAGSEFFGHEKGAFTGASTARDGAFATAHGGTLFLDEISELELPLQAELLRVIQEGMYKRVGSDVWRRTRFRLICATNRELLEEESAGRFRRDLYYRIAGWVVRLPSLRERREDILPLVEHFLSAARPNGPAVVDEAVQDLLTRRDYPGNVRDLRQLVLRMAWRHDGPGPISPGDVPIADRPMLPMLSPESRDDALALAVRRALDAGMTLKEISQRSVEIAIRLSCEEEGGNLQRAARRLGVTDRALQLRRAAAVRTVDSR
jgi:transcriptional regulator with GAF, ATPase, and Fis domain